MLFVVGVELELVAKAARSGRKRKRAAPLASLVASGMSQPLRRSCTLSPSVYHPLPSPPEGTPTTARVCADRGWPIGPTPMAFRAVLNACSWFGGTAGA